MPGDLITDLQRAGVVGDPLYEVNFLTQAHVWQDNVSWTYLTTFALPAAAVGTPLLVFDGIKMGAHILVNGVPVATANNQFLRLVIPLPPSVLALASPAGECRLDVVFDPTVVLNGRFMAATGSWDWTFITNTMLNNSATGATTTFSRG